VIVRRHHGTGVRVYDLRDEADLAHPKSRIRGGRTVQRNPADVDAIVLHQAGVDFADRATELETARRALGVACHAMAFEGFVALPAPLRHYMHHADRLCSRALGLEVDGLYPGIKGRAIKGKTATVLTDAIVNAARVAAELLVELGRAEGMPIRYLYAHRQTDSWRRPDPGQELWEAVVLDYAVPVLGLETRPLETFAHPKGPTRRGWPVPLAWDPAGKGPY
jgi:hypothetical protein